MKSKELIERTFEHLENDSIDKAVMSCLRLARRHKDYFNIVIFLRELYPNNDQIHDVFFDETEELKSDAREYLWKKTLEKWVQERTIDTLDQEHDGNEGQRRNILTFGIGELESQCVQLEKMIDDLKLPTGMGEYDTAAFTDRYNHRKIEIRTKITAIHTVKQRIRTRCLNYAIRLEKQINNQEKANSFIIEAQETVNNYFKEHSEDVFRKIQKASQLLDSKDIEDSSLLLTSVRRSLHAIADHFYPPREDSITCSDGRERKMGNEQYLNRLHEFINSNLEKSTSTDLLKSELEYLASFSRRLNDLASKGVHSHVHTGEAKQCYVGLYMFLYNLVSKLQFKEDLTDNCVKSNRTSSIN